MTNLNKRLYSTKTKDSIKKYLLGGNENLIGTIISLRKGLIKGRYLEYQALLDSNDKRADIKNYSPEGYAALLFFDHRTARVVRFLYNPNLIFWKRKPKLYNFINEPSESFADDRYINSISDYKDISEFNKETASDEDGLIFDMLRKQSRKNKPDYFYNKMEVYPNDKNITPTIVIDHSKYRFLDNPEQEYQTGLYYQLLFTGRITAEMKGLFLHELLSDYLRNGSHYSNCDMEYIYNNKKLLKENIEEVNVEPVLDYPKQREIYIQKSLLINNNFQSAYKNFNISFEVKLVKDSPQVLKDLRSFINPRAIENKKYLIKKIQ